MVDSKSDIRVPEMDELLEERVNERTRVVTRAKRAWEATFDAIVDPLAIVDGELRMTGETQEIEADMVLRAIGQTLSDAPGGLALERAGPGRPPAGHRPR